MSERSFGRRPCFGRPKPGPRSKERRLQPGRRTQYGLRQSEHSRTLVVFATLVFTSVLLVPGCSSPAHVGTVPPKCETPEDCPGELPYCDGEILFCAQCLEASHCAPEGGRCSGGECVCTKGDQCPEAHTCDGERCVPAG